MANIGLRSLSCQCEFGLCTQTAVWEVIINGEPYVNTCEDHKDAWLKEAKQYSTTG